MTTMTARAMVTEVVPVDDADLDGATTWATAAFASPHLFLPPLSFFFAFLLAFFPSLAVAGDCEGDVVGVKVGDSVGDTVGD